MIKLLINGFKADLKAGGASIRLNRSLGEAREINTRSGDFSYSLSLPCTKVNNKIFGNINEVHGLDNFRRSASFSAELFINGINILTGVFKVASITPTEYTGNLYGGSISWAGDLEKVILKAVPFEVAGYNGSAAGRGFFNLLPNQPIKFPLISYYAMPSTNPGTPWDEIDGTVPTLLTHLMPPAVHLKDAIKETFKAGGWSVSGSMFEEEAFKNYILPYCGASPIPLNYGTLGGVIAESGAVNLPFIETAPFPDETPGAANIGYELADFTGGLISFFPTVSALGTSFGVSHFDPNYKGEFLFDIEIENFQLNKTSSALFTPIMKTRTALIIVRQPDPATLNYLDIDNYLNGNTNEINGADVLGFYEFSEDYKPANRDGLTAETIYNNYSYTITPATFPDHEQLSGAGSLRFKIPVNLNTTEGNIQFILCSVYLQNGEYNAGGFSYDKMKVRINQDKPRNIRPLEILQETNGRELVKNWVNTFNLFFKADEENKQITFFDFNKFHLPNDNAIDLNCNADIKNINILPTDTAAELVFGWAEDTHDRLTNGANLGRRVVGSSNVYSEGKKEIISGWAATEYKNFYDSLLNLNLRVPVIQSETPTTNEIEELILGGGFKQRLIQYSGNFITSLGAQGLTTFNGESPAAPLSDSGQNLNFNAEGVNNNLYKSNFEKWVLLLQRSHVIELDAVINENIFNKITLDTPVMFGGGYWYLLEIRGFSPLTGSAKIKLLKIVK